MNSISSHFWHPFRPFNPMESTSNYDFILNKFKFKCYNCGIVGLSKANNINKIDEIFIYYDHLYTSEDINKTCDQIKKEQIIKNIIL